MPLPLPCCLEVPAALMSTTTDRFLTSLQVEAHSRHAFVSGSSVRHNVCEVPMSVAQSSFNFRAVFLPIYHCCLWSFGCFQFGAIVHKAAVNIFVLIFREGGQSTLLVSTQKWDFPGPQGKMLTFNPKRHTFVRNSRRVLYKT